jgi:glycosyltransferase involved in cell wall biosynthesis
MNIEDITPLVLTFNEAPNLRRCLERLRWARRVVVLDSGSTDETVAIAAEFSNVELFVRPFDDHTTQWNYGLTLVGTEWVLTLDADYMVASSLVGEVNHISSDVEAYFCRFRYCVFGRPLRASLYPPRAILFRRSRCAYEEDGHTQRLRVTGRSSMLATVVDHDDRKGLSRWLVAQDRYAVLEAKKLMKTDRGQLRLQDRIRLWMVVAPPLTLIFTLVIKGTAFDGWPGFYYAFQRTLAELLLSLRLLEARLTRGA